jgi:hypothetical protein
MRTNKISLVIIVGFVALLTLSLAMATRNSSRSDNLLSNTAQHKIDYKQCISSLIKEKNTCLKTAQQDRKACEKSIKNLMQTIKDSNQAINKPEIESLKQNCLSKYKAQLISCEAEFKKGKILCEQIQCNESFLNSFCVNKKNKN